MIRLIFYALVLIIITISVSATVFEIALRYMMYSANFYTLELEIPLDIPNAAGDITTHADKALLI